MRFNLPIFRRLSEAARKRDWFGIGFELFVVFLGVLLGVQASRWSAEREERAYHLQMVAALDQTLEVYVDYGQEIHLEIETLLAGFERRRAVGGRPAPPHWRLEQLERPPTLAWDAMVATGIARTLEPKLVFEIARFFSRGDGFGDRYQRYNAFTETHILPYRDQPERFYGPDRKLSPPFAAHVERLRELSSVNDEMTREAAELRRKLRSSL